MKTQIISITAILVFSFFTQAQNKNIFLQRDFWKKKPDIETIQKKIDEGHSIYESNSHAMDAVSYAILENNPTPTISYLIDKGIDVNKLTHDKRTYIFWAGYKGNLELMKYLIDKKAKTDIKDAHGYSLIQFIALGGVNNKEIYDFCIQNGSDITEKDKKGRNILLLYAQNIKGKDMLDYFTKKNISIHSTDTDGNGIFNYAAKARNKEALELLIKQGVSYKANPKTNENAFLFATKRRHRSTTKVEISFLQYLENLGLDPLLVSKTGNSALNNISSSVKNIEVFNYFIQKGANINQVAQNGNTPLIGASFRNTKEIVSLLLKKTKDINYQNNDGYTALTRAIRSNTVDIVEFLIKNGADITLKDKKGYDMGYHLVDGYRRNIGEFATKMNTLTSNGYTINTLQKDSNTLLHLAVKKGKLELVKQLVALQIDINSKNKNGYTALHIAAMTAKEDAIIKFLLESGADKTIKTELNESVYDLAKENEILQQKKITLTYLN
ncbi:ankyrin repeat domain-containing protein [Aquimarina aquimarini]|uniref:ankyrin repeat domain-containing protein n=1 Tax=Aquimarina aquimarini TaxID=1191734 RepID=UPI000D5607DB|nr:ankyrin repeat domain-containing protein [Aquimarina aquimarini]